MSLGNGARILRLGVAGAVSAAAPAMAAARPAAGAFSMAPAHAGHLVSDGTAQGVPGAARFAERPRWDGHDAVEVKPSVFEVLTFAGLRSVMDNNPFGKYLAYRTGRGENGLRFFPGFEGTYHHDLLAPGEGFVVGAGFVMMADDMIIVDGESRGYPTGSDRVDSNEQNPHPLDPDGSLPAVVSIFGSLPGRDIPVVAGSN